MLKRISLKPVNKLGQQLNILFCCLCCCFSRSLHESLPGIPVHVSKNGKRQVLFVLMNFFLIFNCHFVNYYFF